MHVRFFYIHFSFPVYFRRYSGPLLNYKYKFRDVPSCRNLAVKCFWNLTMIPLYFRTVKTSASELFTVVYKPWSLYQLRICGSNLNLKRVKEDNWIFSFTLRQLSMKASWHFGGTNYVHLQGMALLVACFLLGLLFEPENKDMFPRNVGWLSPVYGSLHPRRENSSHLPLWEPQIQQFR
jgi:hypothetical protein